MRIDTKRNKPRKGVSYNGLDDNKLNVHGYRDYKTKMYWNEKTQKWTVKKPSPVLTESIIQIYDFKYYDTSQIKKAFGSKWERVALFLTELFINELSTGHKVDEWPWVYWNYLKQRTYLGNDYLLVIDKLVSLGLIETQRQQVDINNPFKFSVSFKLNIKFIEIEGEAYEKKTLLSEDYQNSILNYYSNVITPLDKIEKYIDSVIDSSKLNLSNDQLIEIVLSLTEKKKNLDKEALKNKFVQKSKKDKIKRKLSNELFYYDSYKSTIRYSIDNIQAYLNGSQLLKSYFYNIRRDTFGNRISHIFSNIPKSIRNQITIDGERVVEVDIISSQVSFLFVLIEKWFLKSSYASDNNLVAPWDFFLKYSTLSLIDKNQDFYKILKIQVADQYKEYPQVSREQMKIIFLKTALGDPKLITLSGFNKKEFISNLFGSKFYDFLISLTKIEIDGVKKHESYKNIAAILQREESAFLDIVMNKLIDSDIKFIPIYDSLIIKESDQTKVRTIFKEVIKSQEVEEYIRIDKNEEEKDLTDYEHNLDDVVIDKDIINGFLKAS
jgi:hypothetical protein